MNLKDYEFVLTISKDALLEGISVLKKAVEEIYVEITNRK